MDDKNKITKNWIKGGFICGFISLLTYPVLLLVELPFHLTLVFACSSGILLSIAFMGLYNLIKLNHQTVSLKIGVIFNVIGCSLVTVMFLVQFSIHEILKNKASTISESLKETHKLVSSGVNSVQLGLDVAWDIYVTLGTILFAINMWNHPRFGKIFSISGLIIAGALLTLNILSFPIPPGETESFDLGPVMALWYLIVTIQTARSMKWVDQKLVTV